MDIFHINLLQKLYFLFKKLKISEKEAMDVPLKIKVPKTGLKLRISCVGSEVTSLPTVTQLPSSLFLKRANFILCYTNFHLFHEMLAVEIFITILLTGFESRTFGVKSNCSTNRAIIFVPLMTGFELRTFRSNVSTN